MIERGIILYAHLIISHYRRFLSRYYMNQHIQIMNNTYIGKNLKKYCLGILT
jgi:hypothetical protein